MAENGTYVIGKIIMGIRIHIRMIIHSKLSISKLVQIWIQIIIKYGNNHVDTDI